MESGRRSAAFGAAAFGLLCAVSLYRQLSLHLWPGDPARPFVVYAVYAALLAFWWVSLRRRVTQTSMRRFLLAEDLLMLFGLTVRFVQDAFLYRDVYRMRTSAYLLGAPVVLLPLLGFYASCGLGQGEGYRLPRRWYGLLAPAAALMLLMLTNERHQLVFRTAREGQVDLLFPPNGGLFLLAAWGAALEFARVLRLRRKGRHAARSLTGALPFAIAVAMPLFCAPYAALSFAVRYELIEFYAAIFFMEAMVWESCILAGMVPVNTRYEEVFRHASQAMQIYLEEPGTWVRSDSARPLSPACLARLRREGAFCPDGETELRLHPIRGGFLVWQKDVSQMQAVIRALRRTAGELEQEATLLREELRMRSEEARLQAQNQIYDQLTEEVGDQLALLRGLLARAEEEARPEPLYRQACLVGAYVKRRCSLRLTERETGRIPAEDLRLGLEELAGCLRALGARAELDWRPGTLSPGFCLWLFDLVERVLEQAGFAPAAVTLAVEGRRARLRVEGAGAPPAPALCRKGGDGRPLRRESDRAGYTLTVWDEEAEQDGQSDESGHRAGDP